MSISKVGITMTALFSFHTYETIGSLSEPPFDPCAPDFTGCPANCTNLVFDSAGNNAGFHCECDAAGSGELEFCENGFCNNNGCDECQTGYFQRDRGSPCVSCSDVFGPGCNFCNNNDGCMECNDGYDRVRMPDCSYDTTNFGYCRPQGCTSTSISTPSPTQPPVTSISRSYLGYYYGISDVAQEWTYNEAETYCITQFNTHLASFHDIEHENDLFLLSNNMINEYNLNIWIGLNDLINEAGNDGSIGSGWQWTDGTIYDYQMRWAPNMPNNKGDCVDIRKTDNLGKDRHCDNGQTRKSFICNNGLEYISILSENENYVGICSDNVNDKWIFSDAELYCNNNFGTNLASIHSLSDENEIHGLATTLLSLYDGHIWIGLNDINNEAGTNSNIGSGWEYTDGTYYDYVVSWYTNEPNADGDCCIIDESPIAMFIRDTACNIAKDCFICNY